MKKFYIYKCTNLINNKIYIGKSNNPQKRWSRHIYDSKKDKIGSKQLLFHRAIRKYGYQNFSIEILSEYDSDKECLLAEIDFIKSLKSNDISIGYNLTTGGEGVAGYHRTPEECKAISERNSGNKNGMYGKIETLESRKNRGKKISKTKNNNKTNIKIISKETIDKLKIAVKEKSSQKLTDEQKDLIVNLYNSELYIKRDLAKQFNVAEKTIIYVLRYWIKIKGNKLKRFTD